jgi:hypothetical protein
MSAGSGLCAFYHGCGFIIKGMSVNLPDRVAWMYH